MSKLNWAKQTCFVVLLCATTAIALPAQTFTTLFNFDHTDGFNTGGALIQATDGNFYGVAANGGAHNSSSCYSGCGTAFKITASGTLTTLYNFCSQSGCTDGAEPYATLVQGTDGNFYGTTYNGGANGGGTVFKITPGGALTRLYSFCSRSNCTDGGNPVFAGLIQATDGNFYGTTSGQAVGGYGTVFKITATGALTTLHSFDGTDGGTPLAGLVEGADGNFYGVASDGGAHGYGTVFKITATGALTTLHSFDGTDGGTPYAGLVEGADGNFYGVTSQDGGSGDGTVFKITPGGALTTLHSFDDTDGSNPHQSLIQATDGNFYGTTSYGAANGYGNIFKITPSGTLTVLHNFDGTDGQWPYGGALLQDTNGIFYGPTCFGGADGDGTIFSLSVGLSPFVELKPTSGKVGAAVNILGSLLTGATSVTFNGTAAAFTVESNSLIKTTVPAGATTGEVEVTKPHGTVSSNVPFRVAP